MTDIDRIEILEEKIEALEKYVFKLNEGLRCCVQGGIMLADQIEKVEDIVYGTKNLKDWK